jgi:hypothetical protein
MGDYFVGGVGVDFEFPAQGAHGGKGIARAELAGHHGFGGGVNHLLVDGAAGTEGDMKWEHARVL